MNPENHQNYARIAQAIEYIGIHFKQQPDLDAVAASLHLSPFHFQRMFTEWAGVSPKKFLQYISLSHSKDMLRNKKTTLFDAADETGLSGTGRLHDLFVNIEGMTPGVFRNGGKGLSINYGFFMSPFGTVLIASTSIGICHLAFADDSISALKNLKSEFPSAEFKEGSDAIQQKALAIIHGHWGNSGKITLHLKGTPFQIKVWEALLQIPLGNLTTYGKIAARIDQPKSSRAVGSAIGANPVAFLIPCHRVIQASGIIGQYRWGSIRKTALIGWEGCK